MKLRSLIVDDEPLARDRIATLLKEESDAEVIGECSNGDEAIQAIKRQRPDLLFLDIQMPQANGFEVLKSIKPITPGFIVFVSA